MPRHIVGEHIDVDPDRNRICSPAERLESVPEPQRKLFVTTRYRREGSSGAPLILTEVRSMRCPRGRLGSYAYVKPLDTCMMRVRSVPNCCSSTSISASPVNDFTMTSLPNGNTENNAE